MRRPVNAPFVITTEFGVRDSNAKFGYHSGVDYAVPLNRPIYAPVSGQLTNVVSPTGGNMVVIKDNQGLTHRLMHNNSFSRGNGPVSEGEEVAKAGTTGLSTGVHSHWDINKEGTYPTSFAAFIPPADWLAGKYVTTPQGGEVLTLQTARILAERVLGRAGAINGATDADLNKNHVGKDANAKILEFEGSTEGKAYQKRLADTVANAARVPVLEAKVTELGKVVAIKDKEIESLKAQVGDNTKWNTLKALIRELVGAK